MVASEIPTAPDVHLAELGEGRSELRFRGELTLPHAARVDVAAREALAGQTGPVLLQLEQVTTLDGASAALLMALRADLRQDGHEAEFVGARGQVGVILGLYDDTDCRACGLPPPAPIGTLDQIGRTTLELVGELRGVLDFLGAAALSAAQALRHPASVRWRDMGRLMERAGADALPIVSLIAFLVGVVTAYQSAGTLKEYGANIYVADLVGLAMFREMGPLMTAILVAGRSGSGIAAELGTMKVSEEIDALRALGLCPIRFLVIPRVLALLLMVPLLTVAADIIGVLGGMLVGMGALDLTIEGFLGQLQRSLGPWDMLTGLIKALAFAFAIGLIASERGLSTRGGAEGVGRATTSAVVTILFHLVIITAALTIVFSTWDI